ncbi:HEAT repeat domain-containing protein [Glutamicibacter protophormiae]|nr:HEAT repeat domain-containing protein [Glutamicibacter protophormiae]
MIEEATLHPDPAVRHVAATVIGVRPVPGAAPVVRDRLAQETDPRALAAFVGALGWVGGAQDLAVLSELARHRDESVALAAVESLERLGLPASVAALAPWSRTPGPGWRSGPRWPSPNWALPGGRGCWAPWTGRPPPCTPPTTRCS